MAFTARKITDGDIATYGVQGIEGSKLIGSASDNKKVFDKLIEQVVQEKLNGLIDDLIDQTAAGQIGCEAAGVASTNVNAALAEIYALITTISQGDVPNGSITHAKLSADPPAVQNDNLSGILPAYVGIKMGTATPTAAQPGAGTATSIEPGQIYLKYST